jgi:hypothetical protein
MNTITCYYICQDDGGVRSVEQKVHLLDCEISKKEVHFQAKTKQTLISIFSPHMSLKKLARLAIRCFKKIFALNVDSKIK